MINEVHPLRVLRQYFACYQSWRPHQSLDGSCVELQIDNFETGAEFERWMRSDAFAANPD